MRCAYDGFSVTEYTGSVSTSTTSTTPTAPVVVRRGDVVFVALRERQRSQTETAHVSYEEVERVAKLVRPADHATPQMAWLARAPSAPSRRPDPRGGRDIVRSRLAFGHLRRNGWREPKTRGEE